MRVKTRKGIGVLRGILFVIVFLAILYIITYFADYLFDIRHLISSLMYSLTGQKMEPVSGSIKYYIATAITIAGVGTIVIGMFLIATSIREEEE